MGSPWWRWTKTSLPPLSAPARGPGFLEFVQVFWDFRALYCEPRTHAPNFFLFIFFSKLGKKSTFEVNSRSRLINVRINGRSLNRILTSDATLLDNKGTVYRNRRKTTWLRATFVVVASSPDCKLLQASTATRLFEWLMNFGDSLFADGLRTPRRRSKPRRQKKSVTRNERRSNWVISSPCNFLWCKCYLPYLLVLEIP